MQGNPNPVALNDLVPGRLYWSVRRAGANGRNIGAPQRFITISGEGFARFNAGHGATTSANPAAFYFYEANDPAPQTGGRRMSSRKHRTARRKTRKAQRKNRK